MEPIALADTTLVAATPVTLSAADAIAEAKATQKILDTAKLANAGHRAPTAAASAKVRVKAPVHRELDSIASLEDDDPLTGL